MNKRLLLAVTLAAMAGWCIIPCRADAPWYNRLFSSWLPKPAPKTVQPVSRPEQWWKDQHKQLVERAHQGNVGLLFLGDSITQGMDHAADIITELWGKHLPANFGIGGDTTQLLLWRLQNGELDGVKPAAVVLLIGTNNLGGNSDADIAAGIAANVREIRKRLPEAKVLVLGILPRGHEAADPARARIKHINEQIAGLANHKQVFFADVGEALLEKDGSIAEATMSDYLHPTHEGYKRMFEALKRHVDPLL